MKYVCIISIVLIRIIDLYLTYLLEGNALTTEVSPIVCIFNGNWVAMMLSNVFLIIVMALIIFRYDNMSYLSKKENENGPFESFLGYLNCIYFDEFHVVNYFKAKLDIKVFLCIFVHLLPYIVIFQGVLAIVNNLSAYIFSVSLIYGIPKFAVIHLFVLISAIVLVLFNVLFCLKRFRKIHV